MTSRPLSRPGAAHCGGAALFLSRIPVVLGLAAWLLLAAPAGATVYNVSTAADLTAKLGIVNPGDQIILANGTYAGNFTLTRSGTQSLPILIKSLNPAAATFTNGEFKLACDWAQLERFTFNNSGVWVTGNNNRVTRNTFINGTRTYVTEDAAVAFTGTASFNRCDYNEITNWAAYGIRITGIASGMTGNRMDHNYIHDSNTVSNAEATQLGSGSGHAGFSIGTIFEYNLIENIGTDEDGEAISVKSSGNIVRANTWKNCSNKVVQSRHAANNKFINNTIINMILQAFGDNHCLIGNHVIAGNQTNSGNIYIPSGDTTHTIIVGPPVTNGHPAAQNVMVAGNIVEGTIILGRATSGSYTPYDALNTTLAENENASGGPAAIDTTTYASFHTGTQILGTYPGGGCGPIGTPVLMTAGMVGPNAPPEAGTALVGHWKLDESSGTNANDETASNNDGTLSGGPTWTAGQLGNALAFDGVDDKVTVGSGATTTFDNLPAITVAGWINATNMGEGGFGRIASKATAGAGWEFMTAGTNQLTFSVDYSTTDLKRRTNPNTIVTGAWRHVAVTWDGSATATNIKVYVNGQEVGYDTTINGGGTRVNEGTASLYLGNDDAGTRTFNGKLDDLRVYNGVLSAAEIAALFDAGALAAPSGLTATPISYNQINLAWNDNAFNETGYKIERKKGAAGTYAEIGTTGANSTAYNDTSAGAGTTYYYRVRAYNGSGNSGYSNEANAATQEVTAGRQGHWKLDETSGTSAADSSGNANTGTLAGGPTWTAGKIANGLNLDGVDDVVNCGSGTSLDALAALSVAAWINPTNMGEGGFGRIVTKIAAGSAAGWEFMVAGTNQMTFSVDYTTTDPKRRSNPNTISTGTGTWQHVVLTWDGSTTATNIKMYVAGVEVGGYDTTINGAGTRVADGASNVHLGNDSAGTRTFNGKLDDVRVYNRVLSAAEITAIHRAGL